MKNVRKKTGKARYFEESDSFLSFTDKVKLYVQDNPAQAKGVLAAIAAVIGITVIVTLFMDASTKKVQALQSEALGYYDVVSPSPGGTPLPDEERYAKAAELFGKLKAEGSGGAAMLGAFYEANADWRLGKTEDAIGKYSALFGRYPSSLPGSLAGLKLAEAYAETGDRDAAIEALMTLSDTGGFLRDEALYMLGQLYELGGRSDDAGSVYSRITSEYPKSRRASEAKMRLDRLVNSQMDKQLEGAEAGGMPAGAE